MYKITKTILDHGVENVYFLAKVKPLRSVAFISYTTSNDPFIEMLCVIDESRYKVKDGYKITLKPIYEGYASEHYYVSDLQDIIEKGHFKLLVNHSVSQKQVNH